MTTVTYENQTLEVDDLDPLLDTLLDAGFEIPFGCRAGACHSCMMQAIEGKPPADAQNGLKETQKQEGYFLACQCYPLLDMTVRLPGGVESTSGTVTEALKISKDVMRLRLDATLNYKPGQFVNLVRDDGLSRSYSLASVPELDNTLEFHIRILPDGKFSNWADEELFDGDTLDIQGPFGECFYAAIDKTQPLLMACTGTGLAPLYGIIRDALNQGHSGDIYLYAGGRDVSGLYLIKDLLALAEQHPNLHYTPVVLDAPTEEKMIKGLVSGDLNDIIQAQHPDLKGYGVYLCGSESRVNSLRKQSFMSGAAMKEIHYDLFTPAAS